MTTPGIPVAPVLRSLADAREILRVGRRLRVRRLLPDGGQAPLSFGDIRNALSLAPSIGSEVLVEGQLLSPWRYGTLGDRAVLKTRQMRSPITVRKFRHALEFYEEDHVSDRSSLLLDLDDVFSPIVEMLIPPADEVPLPRVLLCSRAGGTEGVGACVPASAVAEPVLDLGATAPVRFDRRDSPYAFAATGGNGEPRPLTAGEAALLARYAKPNAVMFCPGGKPASIPRVSSRDAASIEIGEAGAKRYCTAQTFIRFVEGCEDLSAGCDSPLFISSGDTCRPILAVLLGSDGSSVTLLPGLAGRTFTDLTCRTGSGTALPTGSTLLPDALSSASERPAVPTSRCLALPKGIRLSFD